MALKCKACGQDLSVAVGVLRADEVMQAHTRVHQGDEFRAAQVAMEYALTRTQDRAVRSGKGSEVEKDMAVIMSLCRKALDCINRATDPSWVTYEVKA